MAEAISHMEPGREVKYEYGDGLKECKKMLMMAKAGKRDGYLLEGMACPGGCVAGAGTIRPVKESALNVERFTERGARRSAAPPVPMSPASRTSRSEQKIYPPVNVHWRIDKRKTYSAKKNEFTGGYRHPVQAPGILEKTKF